MASLTLYNYFRSSTSYRIRIVLHHKNLDFEYKAVHLINNGGEQHTDSYKKMNPMSEVPTLIHDGKIIGQSMAIAQYLDEVFPQNPIFPKDPYKKAQILQFCENINSYMHPLANLKVTQYLEKHHQYDQKMKEAWVAEWHAKGLLALEKVLEKESGQFCFGDTVSAADMFLVPQIFSSNRFHVPMDKYPLCKKISEHCNRLPAFQKSHPGRQVDTPADSKI